MFILENWKKLTLQSHYRTILHVEFMVFILHHITSRHFKYTICRLRYQFISIYFMFPVFIFLNVNLPSSVSITIFVQRKKLYDPIWWTIWLILLSHYSNLLFYNSIYGY